MVLHARGCERVAFSRFASIVTLWHTIETCIGCVIQLPPTEARSRPILFRMDHRLPKSSTNVVHALLPQTAASNQPNAHPAAQSGVASPFVTCRWPCGQLLPLLWERKLDALKYFLDQEHSRRSQIFVIAVAKRPVVQYPSPVRQRTCSSWPHYPGKHFISLSHLLRPEAVTVIGSPSWKVELGAHRKRVRFGPVNASLEIVLCSKSSADALRKVINIFSV